ncbi:hypothetical protein HYV86_02715 [Candidatus Woesearchaeota archaeon]|nr:hypothetical protein [Candidatus Woesearchaeota archaeon]
MNLQKYFVTIGIALSTAHCSSSNQVSPTPITICSHPLSLEQRAQEITLASYQQLRHALEPTQPPPTLTPCPISPSELAYTLLRDAQQYHENTFQIPQLVDRIGMRKTEYADRFRDLQPIYELIFNEVKALLDEHKDFLITEGLQRTPSIFFLDLIDLRDETSQVSAATYAYNRQLSSLRSRVPTTAKEAEQIRTNLEQTLRTIEKLPKIENRTYALLHNVWNLHDEALKDETVRLERMQRQGLLDTPGKELIEDYFVIQKRRNKRYKEIFEKDKKDNNF